MKKTIFVSLICLICFAQKVFSLPGKPVEFGGYKNGTFTLYGRSETRNLIYGANGIPLVGDVFGESISRIISYQGNARYYLCVATIQNCPQSIVTYGTTAGIPLLMDADGNKTQTPLMVFRTANGLVWSHRTTWSSGVGTDNVTFGPADGIPLVGDMNNDGKQDMVVAQRIPGGLRWYYKLTQNGRITSGNATYSFVFGPDYGIPVVGDWNGDGSDTVGFYVKTPTNGWFYWRNQNVSGQFQGSKSVAIAFDTPLVGYWGF